MQEPQLDHVLQRLHRVERAQWWWQVGGLVAVSTLGLMVLLGAAGRREATTPVEVRAQKFILVDNNEQPRALWHVDKESTSLFLFDEAGTPRVGLGVGKDGEALVSIYDSAKRPRLTLATSADGRANLGLVDESRQPRVVVDLTPKGIATLQVREPDGKVRWLAP